MSKKQSLGRTLYVLVVYLLATGTFLYGAFSEKLIPLVAGGIIMLQYYMEMGLYVLKRELLEELQK